MVAYPTIVTMLLTGLWHGAGLQFLLFGLIHGIYLTANQAWRHFRQRMPQRARSAAAHEEPCALAMMLGVYVQVCLRADLLPLHHRSRPRSPFCTISAVPTASVSASVRC